MSGDALKRIMRRAEGKSGVVDQWRAEYLNDLPDEAYECMAALWNAILEGGALPHMWTHVRVVTLPKDEGGYRGLGIAAQLWRAGLTAIVGALGDWSEEWLAAELYGGIRGRSADQLHARVMVDRQGQRGGGAPLGGED